MLGLYLRKDDDEEQRQEQYGRKDPYGFSADGQPADELCDADERQQRHQHADAVFAELHHVSVVHQLQLSVVEPHRSKPAGDSRSARVVSVLSRRRTVRVPSVHRTEAYFCCRRFVLTQ